MLDRSESLAPERSLDCEGVRLLAKRKVGLSHRYLLAPRAAWLKFGNLTLEPAGSAQGSDDDVDTAGAVYKSSWPKIGSRRRQHQPLMMHIFEFRYPCKELQYPSMELQCRDRRRVPGTSTPYSAPFLSPRLNSLRPFGYLSMVAHRPNPHPSRASADNLIALPPPCAALCRIRCIPAHLAPRAGRHAEFLRPLPPWSLVRLFSGIRAAISTAAPSVAVGSTSPARLRVSMAPELRRWRGGAVASGGSSGRCTSVFAGRPAAQAAGPTGGVVGGLLGVVGPSGSVCACVLRSAIDGVSARRWCR